MNVVNVDIGTKAGQFLSREYINGIFVAMLSGMKPTVHHVMCNIYLHNSTK
jgi:hypothetical protein